jgi:hypothetical protein
MGVEERIREELAKRETDELIVRHVSIVGYETFLQSYVFEFRNQLIAATYPDFLHRGLSAEEATSIRFDTHFFASSLLHPNLLEKEISDRVERLYASSKEINSEKEQFVSFCLEYGASSKEVLPYELAFERAVEVQRELDPFIASLTHLAHLERMAKALSPKSLKNITKAYFPTPYELHDFLSRQHQAFYALEIAAANVPTPTFDNAFSSEFDVAAVNTFWNVFFSDAYLDTKTAEMFGQSQRATYHQSL